MLKSGLRPEFNLKQDTFAETIAEEKLGSFGSAIVSAKSLAI